MIRDEKLLARNKSTVMAKDLLESLSPKKKKGRFDNLPPDNTSKADNNSVVDQDDIGESSKTKYLSS